MKALKIAPEIIHELIYGFMKRYRPDIAIFILEGIKMELGKDEYSPERNDLVEGIDELLALARAMIGELDEKVDIAQKLFGDLGVELDLSGYKFGEDNKK